MELNKCNTCTFWEFSKSTLNHENGVCRHEKIYSNFHAVNVKGETIETTPIDGISCNPLQIPKDKITYVKTGRNFGCIHHVHKN